VITFVFVSALAGLGVLNVTTRYAHSPNETRPGPRRG
jgi:hypothetical protein